MEFSREKVTSNFKKEEMVKTQSEPLWENSTPIKIIKPQKRSKQPRQSKQKRKSIKKRKQKLNFDNSKDLRNLIENFQTQFLDQKTQITKLYSYCVEYFKTTSWEIETENISYLEKIEIPKCLLSYPSQNAMESFFQQISIHDIEDFIPMALRAIVKHDAQGYMNLNSEVGTRIFLQILTSSRPEIFEKQHFQQIFQHITSENRINLQLVQNINWTLGSILRKNPEICLQIWCRELFPLTQNIQTQRKVLLEIWQFLQIILEFYTEKHKKTPYLIETISPQILVQYLIANFRSLEYQKKEIKNKNNIREKINEEIQKTFPLIVESSIFLTKKSPHKYFIPLLLLSDKEKSKPREQIYDLLCESFENDELCSEQLLLCYPFLLESINQFVTYTFSKIDPQRLSKQEQRLSLLSRNFLNTNNLILSRKFKFPKTIPQEFQEHHNVCSNYDTLNYDSLHSLNERFKIYLEEDKKFSKTLKNFLIIFAILAALFILFIKLIHSSKKK
ncbi:transmembrane protein [Anaeramoeba ignava]|uniref:Transmembrane protein n=1 Tax=Anaeramoeba ignava TaxID=1746090 RepID=A0A9Q0LN38_ANAIG|nr:transmembrane protein [Anaeramoeba ignava]